MTVFRALRGAVCAVFVPIAVIITAVITAVITALIITVPTVRQVSAADRAVEASTPSGAATPTPGTTVLVASEGPTPGGAVAGAPRVGPLDAGVGGTPGHGVWWLFALGAVQVLGLFVMTRRRARLSSPDTAS